MGAPGGRVRCGKNPCPTTSGGGASGLWSDVAGPSVGRAGVQTLGNHRHEIGAREGSCGPCFWCFVFYFFSILNRRGIYFWIFFLFLFWIFFCFSWLLASGFCGFWLLWFLASVASVFVYTYIYLSIFLSFFWQLFSFLFLYLLFLLFSLQRRNKQASKQASTSCSPLDLVCCWGGALRPPPNPPRATKSALHPQHPRLPRNQYFKVNSPVQNFLTKQICLLYLSIYLSVYLSILILSNLI